MVKATSKTVRYRSEALVAVAGEPTAVETLAAAFDRIEDERREQVKLDAVRTRAEAAMLTEELERLTKRHGKDHPRVARVGAMRESVERQAKHAEALARRIDAPAPERGGWTATGRVRHEGGAPAANVEVGFVAATGAAGGLAPTKTDEDGEFYATYPADVVGKLVSSQMQFSLVVRSGRTVVHREPATFALQANAIRQFRVEIPTSAKPTNPSKPTNPKPTKPVPGAPVVSKRG